MAQKAGRGTIKGMTRRIQIEYHPDGYPKLGLVARTLRVRYRKNANVCTLRRRLEKWEHSHNNPLFEARHLEKLDSRLAHELVHVYVAMRERYPQVRPDYIEFAGKDNGDRLASSVSYPGLVPVTRNLLATYPNLEHVDAQILLDLAYEKEIDVRTQTALHKESAYLYEDETRDPTASGRIEIGSMFRRKWAYHRHVRRSNRRNEQASARGAGPDNMLWETSEAAGGLIHEFGHLVDAEIQVRGYRSAERVYRRLSEVVLDNKNPKDTQWRYHLINYPAYENNLIKGSGQGGVVRRRSTRWALYYVIQQKLGVYATTYRDELFAETFALAYCGTTRKQRNQLTPFLKEIHNQGLGVQRLPRTVNQ